MPSPADWVSSKPLYPFHFYLHHHHPDPNPHQLTWTILQAVLLLSLPLSRTVHPVQGSQPSPDFVSSCLKHFSSCVAQKIKTRNLQGCAWTYMSPSLPTWPHCIPSPLSALQSQNFSQFLDVSRTLFTLFLQPRTTFLAYFAFISQPRHPHPQTGPASWKEAQPLSSQDPMLRRISCRI